MKTSVLVVNPGFLENLVQLLNISACRGDYGSQDPIITVGIKIVRGLGKEWRLGECKQRFVIVL